MERPDWIWAIRYARPNQALLPTRARQRWLIARAAERGVSVALRIKLYPLALHEQVNKFTLGVLLSLVNVAPARSELAELDPVFRTDQLFRAERLFQNRDVHELVAMLKNSHLIIQKDVALKLGRLGANEALPLLQALDREYSRFECLPSGEFGVAALLITEKENGAQRKALLAVATEPWPYKNHADSTVDVAGRELSRFSGDDIISTLRGIRTYGAQYTVLAHKIRKLSSKDAIRECISILAVHETPMRAEAAQDLLISFGESARPAVEELKDRVGKQIKQSDPKWTVPKTIVERCDRILTRIEEATAKPVLLPPRAGKETQ